MVLFRPCTWDHDNTSVPAAALQVVINSYKLRHTGRSTFPRAPGSLSELRKSYTDTPNWTLSSMSYPKGLPLYTVWDEIPYHIDSTEDLLSLALTCRTFKKLIIPNHLEYRYIRCSLHRQDVWKFFESQRRLTRGIRFVELIDGPSKNICLLPRVFDDTDLDNTQVDPSGSITDEEIALFIKSLSYMTLLKGFSWEQRPDSPQGCINLSHALTSSAHCLEALCIEFNGWLFPNRPSQFEKLSIWTLTGLTKVIMNSPGPAATEMILHYCPDITHLSLTDLTTPFTISLLQNANWKALKYFTLASDVWTPIPEELNRDSSKIITSFFDRHTNIECLRISFSFISVPKLSPTCLPKLRSVENHSQEEFETLSCFLSNNAISRLTHWKTYVMDDKIHTFPQMDRLKSFCLHDDFSGPETFAIFVMKAPNLEKVYFDISPEDLVEPDCYNEVSTKLLFHMERKVLLISPLRMFKKVTYSSFFNAPV
ncbi:hypothetical protein Clacol_007048 [Clathrus columnatus]|uniref:F-box domain-containing protein n=1 Tax=Clathrus columnatus TaxID=1419009 RepID=A0AAV5AI72_9AGAM|nr:hypothetical protein Clacol_007048 [Clathrus columnatus]